MLKYWIWLCTRENIGARTIKLLLEHFESPEQIFLADAERLHAVNGLRLPDSLLDKDLTESEKIIRECYQKNIHILTYQDAAYPERLRNIDDPPAVLYYQGTLPNFDAQPVVAMVGTRKASAYGLMQAKMLGYQLSKMGAIVISGGADGIDTMSLRGALGGGKSVIAVLGCGVDVTYPKSNKTLFDDIRTYGCLISEYPPGTPANSFHFPARNRILSGLALGVVVVEAPKRSGALITADHALEQGRDVFTMPTNVGVHTSEGNLQLLKEGAIVATEGWDVLKEYDHLFPGVIERISKPIPMGLSKGELQMAERDVNLQNVAEQPLVPETDDKITIDKPQTSAYIDLNEISDKLTEIELKVARLLQDGRCHVDQIIEKTGMSTATVLSALTVMELKGYVKRLPAKYFSLAEKQL